MLNGWWGEGPSGRNKEDEFVRFGSRRPASSEGSERRDEQRGKKRRPTSAPEAPNQETSLQTSHWLGVGG